MSNIIYANQEMIELENLKDGKSLIPKLNEEPRQECLAFQNRGYFMNDVTDDNHTYYEVSGKNIPSDFQPAISGNSPDGHYEVMDGLSPNSDAIQSSSIVEKNNQVNVPTSLTSGDTEDHILQKLGMGKRTSHSFYDYASFTVKSMYKEVEAFTFLDIFYILSGISLLAGGALELDKCPMSLYLPFLAVSYGFLSIVSSILFICWKARDSPSLRDGFYMMITYRAGRIFTIVLCILGMMEIYAKFPPDENVESKNYCAPYLYWSALYIFTLTACVITVILIHTVLAIAWYFV